MNAEVQAFESCQTVNLIWNSVFFFQTQMIFLSLSEILTSHSSESGLNFFNCNYLTISLVNPNFFVKRLLKRV